MNLSSFLAQYFSALKTAGIRYCVLRNHEGLPTRNVGSDLDLLVSRNDVSTALSLLGSLNGVQVTDYSERPYVTSVFAYGIESSWLQVDLISSLSWKGLEYLSVADVLDRAIDHPSCSWIPIPDPIDEGLISFFSSYLIGGFVKAKYAQTYQEAFSEDVEGVVKRVNGAIASKILKDVLHAAATTRYEDCLAELTSVRASLMSRSLRQNPFNSIHSILKHYRAEIGFRYSSKHVYTVAVLGPDGSGKSSVIESLKCQLQGVTKSITTTHLRPKLWRWSGAADVGPVVDPHGKAPKPAWLSHLQLALWWFAYRVDRPTHMTRNATVRIFDRYFDDVLVDPTRYRYGGSPRFARWLAARVPRPDLFVILDVPAEILQARKQEVPFEESARQRCEYARLAGALSSAIVVDASRSVSEVVAEVKDTIRDRLSERTGRRLRSGRRES